MTRSEALKPLFALRVVTEAFHAYVMGNQGWGEAFLANAIEESQALEELISMQPEEDRWIEQNVIVDVRPLLIQTRELIASGAKINDMHSALSHEIDYQRERAERSEEALAIVQEKLEEARRVLARQRRVFG